MTTAAQMSEERRKVERKVEWSLDLDNMRVRAGQFVTEMMGEPAQVKEATLHEPLASAESCQVKLTFAVGQATVKALDPDSPNLFEADLRYIGDLDYQVSGDARRRVKLRSQTDFPSDLASALSKDQNLYWHIRLARHLPLRLDLRGGIGQADLDLSQLTTEKIALNAGVGKIALTLPAGKPITADIQGGVGNITLNLPAGASGKIKIKGGVGQAHIQAAPGSALRLQGKTGLGAINLPKNLIQVEGSRMKGAWQTADFDAAAEQTLIEYSGGVGRLTLDFRENQ